MNGYEFVDWAVLGAVATVSGYAALVLITWLHPAQKSHARSVFANPDERMTFLFDSHELIDATPEARRYLSGGDRGESDWKTFLKTLSSDFPNVESEFDSLADQGCLELASHDGALLVRAEMRGDLVRVVYVDADAVSDQASIDAHTLEALTRELETLRGIADETRFLMWRQTSDGEVTWVNRAYIDTARQVFGPSATDTWPPPLLFDLDQIVAGNERSRRLAVRARNGRSGSWYEVHSTAVGAEILVSAVDAQAAVVAEEQLREFMQTLTKTFAHLTIGLAVFDRARRLALFNPALTDLTGLPVDFLTGRPTLFGFLDKLRDRQMIPEPKDYKTWRKRIVELEAAAADGSYLETWSLSNGLTYRVTGRPHPDGAVAFLFEDVSAEISLTRRFRAELELGQTALDSVEDAIAVFSSSGAMVLSNQAYSNLWGSDPTNGVLNADISDEIRGWMSRTVPTPVWGDVREFAVQTHDRAEWIADVRLKDGRPVTCRFTPVTGGATLARFQIDPDRGTAIAPVASLG